jgi:hypothetical protein
MKSGTDIWGYGTMTSNKIDLELEDGRKYVIHIVHRDGVCLNDYERLHAGFSVRLSPDFVATVKSLIDAETGESAFFYDTPDCCEAHRNQ